MRGYKNEQRENITVGINHNTGDVSYPVYITAFRDEFAIEYYSRGDGYLIFVVSRGICVGTIQATPMNMQQLTEFAGIIREGFHHNFKTNFLDNGGQIEITD